MILSPSGEQAFPLNLPTNQSNMTRVANWSKQKKTQNSLSPFSYIDRSKMFLKHVKFSSIVFTHEREGCVFHFCILAMKHTTRQCGNCASFNFQSMPGSGQAFNPGFGCVFCGSCARISCAKGVHSWDCVCVSVEAIFRAIMVLRSSQLWPTGC